MPTMEPARYRPGMGMLLASRACTCSSLITPPTVLRNFGGVMAVLLAGMCVDLFLSPWLLQLILERILGAV